MFIVRLDFRKKRVAVLPFDQGAYDLPGARAAAQRWADFYGFALTKGAQAAEEGAS